MNAFESVFPYGPIPDRRPAEVPKRLHMRLELAHIEVGDREAVANAITAASYLCMLNGNREICGRLSCTIDRIPAQTRSLQICDDALFYA